MCPKQSDLLRAVPTTVVIWARGKQQLVCPRAAGTGGAGRDRELGLRENYITFFTCLRKGWALTAGLVL